MIDRTFNQEERSTLTQDKRLVLVDPGGTETQSRCGSPFFNPASSALHRRFSGRFLLRDQIQTFPGSSPTPAFVQVYF